MANDLQYVWIGGFSIFTLILFVFIFAKCFGCCTKTCFCNPCVVIFILFALFLMSTIAIVKDADALAETPHNDAIMQGPNLVAPVNDLIDPVKEHSDKNHHKSFKGSD